MKSFNYLVNRSFHCMLIGVFASLFIARSLSAQPLLTGISAFSSSSSGGLASDSRWNTRGGDTIVNIFLIAGTNLNGAFINGPNDSQTPISLPLAPGSYTYTMISGPGNPATNFGMNLFFDGNGTTARISVFGPGASNPGAPFPSFAVDGNASTYSLIGSTIPGANSLSYLDGNTMITLTSFWWALPEIYNLDRVFSPTGNPGQLGSDGLLDCVGQFSLVVTEVPEPNSAALFGIATVGGVLFLRRTRTRIR